MAFYSFGRIKIISRSGVRSAVATAAYHSGTKIENEYDGVVHDHTRKRSVGETYVRMPESAPATWRDENVPAKERLARIWNDVEMASPAENAQLARSNYLALPRELPLEESLDCVDRFIERNCTSKGMGVTYTFHDKRNNPHVDLMYLMREYDESGKPIQKAKKEYLCRDKGGQECYFDAESFKRASGYEKVYKYQKGSQRANMTPSEASELEGWERINKHPVCRTVKVSGWDDPDLAKKWRKSWEEVLNEKFEELGIDARVDSRSHKERGLSILPTKHEGWGPEREENRRYNADVQKFNADVLQLQVEARDELRAIQSQVTALRSEAQSEESIEEQEKEYRRRVQKVTILAHSSLFSAEWVTRLLDAIENLKAQFASLLREWKERLLGKRRGDVSAAADRSDEAAKHVRDTFGKGIDDILANASQRFEGGAGAEHAGADQRQHPHKNEKDLE